MTTARTGKGRRGEWLRRGLGALGAAAAAALAALVLGEYEFEGLFVPIAAGLGVGLLVAEVLSSLARWRGWGAAIIAALLAAGSLVWAGWIDSDQGVEPYPRPAAAAAALGAITAAARSAPRHRRRDAPSDHSVG